MKTICKLLWILCILPFYSYSFPKLENLPISKEKTITKAYFVNPDATVQINNSYGTIAVQLWDENKISITAKITVNGTNESVVMEKLEATSIEFTSTTKALIGAKTVFPTDKGWSWNRNSKKVNFQINYTVLLPKKGNVILSNNYGEILLPKLYGSANIKCNYGDITAGELLDTNNSISLNYSGNTTIDYAAKLNCSSNYSDITVAKGENLTISGNYNKYQLSNLDKINGAGNYNDYKVRNASYLGYSGNYTDFILNQVASTTLDINYGQVKNYLQSNYKDATITANYSSIKIYAATNMDFDFDIRCIYGNLKTDLDLNYSVKSMKNNINQYKGNFNSNGKSKITISTNYGSVQLLKSK